MASGRAWNRLGWCVILVGFWLIAGLWAPPVAARADSQLAAEEPVSEPGQVTLTPLGNLQIGLDTHTAELRLTQEGEAWLIDATLFFRIHNADTDAVLLSLRVDPPDPSATALEGSPQLFQGETELLLSPSLEGEGLIAQVSLEPDERAPLRLTYRVTLPDGPTAQLGYATAQLNPWSSSPESTRISLFVDTTVPEAAWLGVTPEGWRRRGDEIRWLFEGRPPGEGVRLRFIHPQTWSALERAIQVEDSLTAGRLYTELYAQAGQEEEARSFYQQALAALQTGLAQRQAAGAGEVDLVDYRYGLARLYRSRILSQPEPAATAYVALMLQELQAAFSAPLPATPQAEEMARWQVEGLTMNYRRALREQDWSLAAAGLQSLAALPGNRVDADYLAREQRYLNGRQAIQLLRQGRAEEATALTGIDLTDPSLMPPPPSQSLFESWQVTMTVTPQTIHLDMTAAVLPGREAALQPHLDHLEQLWTETGLDLQVDRKQIPDAGLLRLVLEFDAANQGPTLARALLPNPNWSLLRLLLTQASAQVSDQVQGLWAEQALNLTLDLRAAADQWQALAADLGRQAADFGEAPGATLSMAEVDEAVRREVRRLYHEEAARQWQGVAANSLVQVRLTTRPGDPQAGRTWLVTPEGSAQTMTLQERSLDPGRVRLLVLGLFAGIFILALTLWRLL